MKNARKLTSILVLIAMLFMIAAPAMADNEDGSGSDTPATPTTGNSITVKDAQAGETYAIYKMLDLEVNADKSAFSYTVNSAWTNFFTGNGAGADYVTIDQGYVTWKDDKKEAADMEAFGKAAAAFAADNNVSAAKDSQTPTANGDITFSDLVPGYYMITSTNGTKVIVDTTPTNPNPSIAEKNVNPTIDKQVQEDSKADQPDGGYGDVNDAEIGQTVNFKTVVHAKSGAKSYIVHNKMSAGLTFDATSVIVKAKAKDENAAEVTLNAKSTTGDAVNPYSTTNPNGYQYEMVTTGLEADNPCDFHIKFVQAYLDTINADTDITITYSATLNSQAVIAGEGNPNETKLNWGNSNETMWDKTVTYVWEMDILKYGNKDEAKVLEGAQFVLLSSDKTKVAKFNAEGKITEWVNIPNEENGEITWPGNTTQTTGTDGKIYIKGLDSTDNYFLREVKAPDGYNLLKDDQPVTISATENVANKTMSQTSLTSKINNQSGTELPSTGGIGTTIFYVVGAALVVGAGVLLVTKKRMTGQR